jgi:hypothetical protein
VDVHGDGSEHGVPRALTLESLEHPAGRIELHADLLDGSGSIARETPATVCNPPRGVAA